jgi:hypothetical protein
VREPLFISYRRLSSAIRLPDSQESCDFNLREGANILHLMLLHKLLQLPESSLDVLFQNIGIGGDRNDK